MLAAVYMIVARNHPTVGALLKLVVSLDVCILGPAGFFEVKTILRFSMSLYHVFLWYQECECSLWPCDGSLWLSPPTQNRFCQILCTVPSHFFEGLELEGTFPHVFSTLAENARWLIVGMKLSTLSSWVVHYCWAWTRKRKQIKERKKEET